MSFKIKLPAAVKESNEATTPQSSTFTSRKKKKRSTSERSPSPGDVPMDDDVDIDMVSDEDEPAVSPTGDSPPPTSVKGKGRSAASSSKRNSKKKNIVYSEEDDDFDFDAVVDDDQDDDFTLPPSPSTSAPKGRRNAPVKSRSRSSKPVARDETKVMDQDPVVAPKSGVGTKRARGSISSVNVEDVEPVADALNTTTESAAKDPILEEIGGTVKKRKLPPIKKNKSYSGITQPSGSGGTLTPTSASASASNKPETAPLVASSSTLTRKPAALMGNADIDLSNSDVYNSLFKSQVGSASTKAGLNGREKEEERKRELCKMRDKARSVRMAQLQKSCFDLLAGQEKVANFEAKLKAQNSVALFPHHLGSYLRHKGV